MSLFAQIETTKEENELIHKIVERAESLGVDYGDRITRMMDLTAAHWTCPLKLEEMLEGNNVDLLHDIYGIAKSIDRDTGELRDCFLPRFSLPEDDQNKIFTSRNQKTVVSETPMPGALVSKTS